LTYTNRVDSTHYPYGRSGLPEMACQLFQKALTAHGGIERWNRFEKVQATIITGGQLFEMTRQIPATTPESEALSAGDSAS
jgi:hypothetical protein